MFSGFVFVCLVAQITSTRCASLDTSAGSSSFQQPQGKVPPSHEISQLTKFQKKLDELEKMQESLMKRFDNLYEEIGLLREAIQKTGATPVKQKRMRRMAAKDSDVDSLPTEEFISGTNGCSISVTSLSLGDSCILCPAGPPGHPGPAGPPGKDGSDAIAATTANPDSRGTNGPSLPNVTPPSNTSGALFIRWGHHSCPSTSTMVYSGSAAAPSWNLAGGGADQLCLPDDPVYDEVVDGIDEWRGSLYGLEYQIDSFPTRNDRGWYDVPCAVCKAPSRFAKLMIPGKNTCPSEEWTFEYGGYLMAERSYMTHHRSLHICVDREMEILDRTKGMAASSASGVIDFVESRCSSSGGGVPCGPYIDGHEMTCAVCTM